MTYNSKSEQEKYSKFLFIVILPHFPYLRGKVFSIRFLFPTYIRDYACVASVGTMGSEICNDSASETHFIKFLIYKPLASHCHN